MVYYIRVLTAKSDDQFNPRDGHTHAIKLLKLLKNQFCFWAGELGEQLLLQVQFPVPT